MEKIKSFFKNKIAVTLLILGIISISAGFLLIINMVQEKMNTYTIEDAKLYQYFNEQRFDYDTKLVLSNKDEITELKINDETVTLDSTPFYWQKEKKVLFPQTMSVVFPRENGLQRRVPYFTILDGTNIDNYLKYNTTSYALYNSFLYDGNDLYFFPNETVIEIDGKKYNLTPYSYAIVRYDKECILYNYELDTVEIIQDAKDVFVSGDGYKLNLKIDSIIYGEKARLLLKNLDYLTILK